MRSLLVLLFVLPAASAGSVPAIGFLTDDGAPVAPGAMVHDWPEGNESSARLVPPQIVGKALFVYAEEAPGDAVQGRMLLGLWPDADYGHEATLVATAWIDDKPFANATAPVVTDPSQFGDPANIIPPDPSDPQGAVMHAAQQAAPLVMSPPMLLDFGNVDVQVPEGSKLSISMHLDGPALPAAASLAIKYDSLTTPGFLYVPWTSSDASAEAPQAQPVPAEPAPSTSQQPEASGPAPSPQEEATPLPVPVALGAVAAAVGLMRRLRF